MEPVRRAVVPPHDTGVALLPTGAEPPLILTGSGALLWDLVAASVTLVETSAVLAERHGKDPAVVSADVAPVLEELVRRGVLVAAPDQAAPHPLGSVDLASVGEGGGGRAADRPPGPGHRR